MAAAAPTFAEVTGWIGTFFWPLVRIGAMLLASPVFGAAQIVPARVRVGLALAVTLVVVSSLEPAPAMEPLSWQGLATLASELVLGLAMGFLLTLAFATLSIGGQMVAMTTGLGFANFIDPQNGAQTPVVSHLYTILGTLLFLALNGHLVVIQVVVEGFETLPPGQARLDGEFLILLALWGSKMFVGALLIALPAMAAITLINIAFGIMSRAAPQLNIFSVGFPTTMAAGYLIMFLTLPNLLPRFTAVLMEAFDLMQAFALGEVGHG